MCLNLHRPAMSADERYSVELTGGGKRKGMERRGERVF